jgi:hypothetical protein
MSDTYIIEVGSQPAGIVVRNPEGYRFFAASHPFNRLEGQVFRNPREAERAAARLAAAAQPMVSWAGPPSLRAKRRGTPAFQG